MFRSRLRKLFIALAFLLFTVSCDPALTYLGITNAAAPRAVEIDMLCDYGGAPCTPDTLRTVVDAALTQTALRPGSVLRLWWLGNSVGDTMLIGSMTICPSRGESLRAREAHRERTIETGRAFFAKASKPFFTEFARRRSPIFESIGKIALASSGGSRELWMISDLLEESIYRFECGTIPDEKSLRDAVSAVLPENSLRGVTVRAIYASPSRIDRDRCPVSVARFRAITALYKSAVEQGGGRFLLSPTSTPILGVNQ